MFGCPDLGPVSSPHIFSRCASPGTGLSSISSRMLSISTTGGLKTGGFGPIRRHSSSANPARLSEFGVGSPDAGAPAGPRGAEPGGNDRSRFEGRIPLRSGARTVVRFGAGFQLLLIDELLQRRQAARRPIRATCRPQRTGGHEASFRTSPG